MKKIILAISLIAISSAAVAADTNVTVPVGDWLSQTASVAVTLLGLAATALIGAAVKFLPPQLQALANEKNINAVDRLAYRAIDFGINKIVDAAKGKEITVDLRNELLAHGVQYVIDHGPEKLIDWMGGPKGIEEKLISRLPFPADLYQRINGYGALPPPAPAA